MNITDNALIVVRKALEHYNVPVTSKTVTENLLSHPQYPSLKSICDLFDELKIDNYPMRMNKEELFETEAPFIAHLKNSGEKLVFVPSLNRQERVEYFDEVGKSKIVDEKEFFEQHTGVSVLIDPDENSGEANYVEKRQSAFIHQGLPYLAGVGCSLILGYMAILQGIRPNISPIDASLIFTKLLGLVLSTLLIFKDFNISNHLVNTLCNFNKKANCNSILNTKAAKVIGWLHWSDVGLIYFTTNLVMMLSIPTIGDHTLMAVFSCFTLTYVVFSIYYQAAKAKVWCPLCLGVQVIFLVEAGLYLAYWGAMEWTWIALIKYSGIALTVSFGVMLYKGYVISRQSAWQEKIAYLRLKKNPRIFISLLHQGDQKDFTKTGEVFVTGNPKGRIVITAFLSLACTPCKRAFNQLKELVDREQIRLDLVFSLNDNEKTFVNLLAQGFLNDKPREAIELLDLWYNSESDERKSLMKKTNESVPSDDCFETLKKVHNGLFNFHKISATPTVFVNGHIFPQEYEFKDLARFIEILDA